MLNIVLGPPGTGKTERLLSLVDEYLSQGISSKDIGFLAFTKKAADEAKTRAMKKFNLGDRELPYFRTIHSLAFRQLGLSKIQVMQKEHYRELGERLGIEIKGYADMDEGSIAYGMSAGDRLIFLDGLARTKMITVREQWEQGIHEDTDWFELQRVSKGLQKYKEATGMLDFTDMLELFCVEGHIPKLKVLFIDEAQDLSKLQWTAVDTLIRQAQEVYVAGDDDQSIFAWSGADTERFIKLQGKVFTLNRSYRVPKTIQKIAIGLVNQINNRREKTWEPKESEGNVYWHNDLDTVPLDQGEWLLLARNGYMLKQYEDHCLTCGLSFEGKASPLKSPALTAIRYWEQLRRGEYLTPDQIKKINNYMFPAVRIKDTISLDNYKKLNLEMLTEHFGLKTTSIWHQALGKISISEREYFIAARRRGETLVGRPRIKISTIHGVKGGQAENVLLMTDLAPRTYGEMNLDLDNELRVFYVAVTRAKESLHILNPYTNMCFNI